MKVKIDGHEIEAEADVLRSLLFQHYEMAVSLVEKAKEEPASPIVSSRSCVECGKPLSKYKRRLCGDPACLKKNSNERVKKWYWKRGLHKKRERLDASFLSKRMQAINSRAKEISLQTGLPYQLSLKQATADWKKQRLGRGNFSEAHRDYLSKRFEFISRRGKEIAKRERISYAYGKAKASLEWEANKKRKKYVPSFPKISGISETGLEVLEGLFKHAIANTGRLTYLEVRNNVSRSGGEEWNGRSWHDFMSEAQLKSAEIFAYFGAKGTLKQVLDMNGYDYLKFER